MEEAIKGLITNHGLAGVLLTVLIIGGAAVFRWLVNDHATARGEFVATVKQMVSEHTTTIKQMTTDNAAAVKQAAADSAAALDRTEKRWATITDRMESRWTAAEERAEKRAAEQHREVCERLDQIDKGLHWTREVQSDPGYRERVKQTDKTLRKSHEGG